MIQKVFFIILSSSLLYGDSFITQELINRAEKKYGTFAKNRFVYIRDEIINKLKNRPDRIKLNYVNREINKIKYASDRKLYKKDDYWATPYEFIGKNRGDCEDYVIAKYYILKELGVDPHRMKFLYVIYKNRRGEKKSHMVLAYLTKIDPKSRDDYLIMDSNLRIILPASKRPRIVKIVAIVNGDTGSKSKKWKQLEKDIKRKKLFPLLHKI